MDDEYDLYMINPNGHQMADSMPWVSDGWCITSDVVSHLGGDFEFLEASSMIDSACSVANNFIGQMING